MTDKYTCDCCEKGFNGEPYEEFGNDEIYMEYCELCSKQLTSESDTELYH